MPPMDDQLRMTPPPVGSMARMPCLVPSMTPLRSTAITRSYSSSVMSATACAPPMPATLHTTSTLPNESSGGREHGLDLGLVGHVDRERDAGGAQLRGRLLLTPAHVGGEDLRALPHEHRGRRPGHPGPGPGEHRDLAVELAHRLPPDRCWANA